MKFKNSLNLQFHISDYKDITHEDITKALELTPNNMLQKTEQSWIYAPYKNTDDFGALLNKILNDLEPKIQILREYSKKYHCSFFCPVLLTDREKSGAPWIFLDERYNAFIREVNTSFDMKITDNGD